MKGLLKRIFYLFLSIKVCFIKIYAKIIGDHIINSYIERCSPRSLPYVLNKFGAKVSQTANIHEGLILDNTYFKFDNLIIEDNCFIGKKVFFDMVKPIVIKSGTAVSAGVSILTHQDVGDRPLNEFYTRKEDMVVLDEGCWIGANSTILSGVHIGKCSVVAAGSVVTTDVPDYTVFGGVPARYIKKLEKVEPMEE